MGFEFDELSGKVIAAAIEVHRRLGPGFVEPVYQKALEIGLSNRRLPFEAQKRVDVTYDGQVVGVHVLDLLIARTMILELKAAKSIDDTHCAQLRSYLRATGVKVGLVLNFAEPKLAIKRLVNQWKPGVDV